MGGQAAIGAFSTVDGLVSFIYLQLFCLGLRRRAKELKNYNKNTGSVGCRSERRERSW